MNDKPDARVTMVWPKELKDQVQQIAGPRGLTEFVVTAVQQHLKIAPSLDAVTEEVNQTKALVQTLADKLVLGGDTSDRLQSLLEVEFPAWIETVGWPVAFAELVHARRAGDTPSIERTPEVSPEPVERQPAAPKAQEGAVFVDESQITRVGSAERHAAKAQADLEAGVEVPTEPEVELEPEPEVVQSEVVEDPAGVAPVKALGDRDDLFARVLKQTGQDLSDMPGLKPASELATPAPKEQVHNHAWERTDGVLRCECRSWIDDSDPAYPNGIVREEGWSPPAEEAAENAVVMCPKGHGELIDGECWTCS